MNTPQPHDSQDPAIDTDAPTELDAEAVDEIGGGLSCSPDDLTRLTGSLKESYENLVDFTSHVIERVIGK